MAFDALAGLQLLITLVTAGLTAFAWRYRERPGGTQFAALAGGTAALSFVYFVLLLDPESAAVGMATVSMRDTVLSVIPILWIVFALDYTGYGQYVTHRTVGAIAVIPTVTAGILWFPGLRELYWGPQLSTVAEGVVEVAPPFGPWYWVNLGYGYILMMGGLVLLFSLIMSQNRLYSDQSFAVVVGTLVPFAANLMIQVDVNPIPLPLQPLSFAVTGLAFGFALYRYELFSVLPVTRQIGRSAVVEDIQEGILIGDRTGRIVDLNETAAGIFDGSADAIVGRPIREVFGDQTPTDGDRIAPTEYRLDDGRVYDVTVSEIHDLGDRPVGDAIVFRDITDRTTREQRLKVLSRLLQHDLRDDLSMVRGTIELAATRADDDVGSALDAAEQSIEELLVSVETARSVQNALEETELIEQDLGEVAKSIVQRARETYPDATVTASVSGAITVQATIALEDALWELLENACEHGGDAPRVEVEATSEDHTAEVTIADDGPGIPAAEYRVLGDSDTSALDDGTGLGLWLAYWGLSASGGALDFDVGDGTTVRVSLPLAGAGV